MGINVRSIEKFSRVFLLLGIRLFVRAFKFETQQVDQYRRIPGSRFRNQDSFLTFFRKNITYVLSRLPCVEGAFEAVAVAPWRLQRFEVL